MDKDNNNRINSYESSSFPCSGILCRVDADATAGSQNSIMGQSSRLDPTCSVGMLQNESCFSKTQWKNRYKKQPTCINCQQAALERIPTICNPHQPSIHHPHLATDIVVAPSLDVIDSESLKLKKPEENCGGHHYNEIELPVKLDDQLIVIETSKFHDNSSSALQQISLIENSTVTQIPRTGQDMDTIELKNVDKKPVGDAYSEKASQHNLDAKLALSSIDSQALVDSARLDNDVVDVNLDRSTNDENKNTNNVSSNEYETTFAGYNTNTCNDKSMPLHDQTSTQLKRQDRNDLNVQNIQTQSSLIDSIPRKRRFLKRRCNNNTKDESFRSKSYRPTLYDDDDDQEEQNSSSDYDDNFESLERMKENILGRKLVTSTSPFNDSNMNNSHLDNDFISPIHPKMDDSLRMELSCPICHDILYSPVSLLCGHSFCYQCIHWWIVRSRTDQIQDRENQRLNNNEETNGGNKCQKCPTCRSVVLVPNNDLEDSISLCVNRALEAALGVLFPNETKTRYQIDCRNLEKAVDGENEGRHSKGFVELTSIDDITESLHSVFQSMLSLPHHTKSKKILMIHSMKARRSLILDRYDQRMRLCLALFGKPAIVKASKKIMNNVGLQSDRDVLVLNVDICLLHVEEDEAEEGIPFRILKGSDDESFITVRDPNYFSMIEATMITQTKPNNTHSVGKVEDDHHNGRSRKPDRLVTHTQPVTRMMLGEPGIVTFSIDIWKYLDQIDTDTQNIEHNIVLQFCHTETNAQLNLHLPFSVENEAKMKTAIKHNRIPNKDAVARHRTNFNETSDSDNEDEDAFEDDGFVVNDDDDTDDDIFDVCVENDQDNNQVDVDDSEGCCICHGHGEMIVCDGGDNQNKSKGCDRSFHIHCIGLHFIPPGDWICETCAMNDLGLETGTQGYEFPAIASDDVTDRDDNGNNDSDNSESKKETSTNRKRFVLDSSGDADEDLEDMIKYHNEKRIVEEDSIASDNASTGNKRSRFSPDISENTADADSETSSPIKKRTFVRKKATSRQIFCDDDDSDEND